MHVEKWYLLLFLLCPIMHLLMMRGHKHGSHAGCNKASAQKPNGSSGEN